jgi:hypothetical protein
MLLLFSPFASDFTTNRAIKAPSLAAMLAILFVE